MATNIQSKYDHRQIESKWQKYWQKHHTYQTKEDYSVPKYYILDMFPYPSGAGLHVGHPKGYIATDIYARMRRLQGESVLHPMGWDAFGLPAENHALKTGTHPRTATAENIKVFKNQLEMLGLAYDWDREIATTDPEFYKWTQWCFLKFWEHYYDEKLGQARPITELIETKFGPGKTYYDLHDAQKAEIDAQRLAFESYAPINWCPVCQTGLANEDLEDGKCERCGSPIEKKPMRQWILRITKYAQRILDDLAKLPAWEEFIKQLQVNWIGRSEGWEVEFTTESTQNKKSVGNFRVFTTRIDTLYGVTYVVLAPESQLVADWLAQKNLLTNAQAVKDYQKNVANKSDLERTDLNKDKTGIALQGVRAINPINGESLPIWIGDYVLADYGTGAVMAVPAHDERDWDFAQKYNLPMREVIVAKASLSDQKSSSSPMTESYAKDGFLIDSAEFSGLPSTEARSQIGAKLTKEGKADFRVNYKIKDWVFSRQRYWGEPIPMIHCDHCGLVPVPEDQLPLELPDVDHYQPSGTGESPLAIIDDWLNVKCPICGGPARREANTMPQWAGSSWYYLRYCDPHNSHELISPQREQYWNPVDFYVGGAEHATRHLIYARFWHKFLYDIGVVSRVEPFTRLQHVGLIMAEDGRKMSKRWGNVINPDDIVEKYGADSLRLYEMFMSPFGQSCAWNTNGVVGVRKFLEKIWNLQSKVEKDQKKNAVIPETSLQLDDYRYLLHQTIDKVTRDISEFKFNTAVSALMILVNRLGEEKGTIAIDDYRKLILILSPFAPHLAEEIWQEFFGEKASIVLANWPEVDERFLIQQKVTLAIQINGKLRGQIEVATSEIEDQAKILSLAKEALSAKIADKKIIKEIYIPGKVVNLVIN